MTRVLLADDDDLLAAFVQVKLEGAGFQVTVAHDGLSAFDQARRSRPDVVVLDAMMPGYDGFEVMRKLRNDAVTRDIPVLMLTALRHKDDVIKAMRAGVRDYVVKPFRPEELIARLRRVIAEEASAPAQAAS